jgi:hypothetical protein
MTIANSPHLHCIVDFRPNFADSNAYKRRRFWGWLGGHLQFELVQQQGELGFGLGVAAEQQLAVVGRCTSIICTAANFSSTLRGVSPARAPAGAAAA